MTIAMFNDGDKKSSCQISFQRQERKRTIGESISDTEIEYSLRESKFEFFDNLELGDQEESLDNSIEDPKLSNVQEGTSSILSLSYQKQLENIIHVVQDGESHLFEDEEWKFINQFHSLSDNSKEVLFRLLSRPLKYIRISKVKWPSISNITQSIQDLENLKYPYLNTDGSSDFREWLELLTKEELKYYCNYFSLKTDSKFKNSNYIEILLDYERNRGRKQMDLRMYINQPSKRSSNSAFEEIKKNLGCIVKLDEKCQNLFHKLCIVYHRCTSWSEIHDILTNSILTNLKQNRRCFPAYKVDRISLTWPTRECFLNYVKVLKQEHQFEMLVEEKKAQEALDLHFICYEQWRKLISLEEDKKVNGDDGHITGIPWLQVFTDALVMTRVMHHSLEFLYSKAIKDEKENKPKKIKFGSKAQHALTLGQFQHIITLLEQLLHQRFFLRSKRGKWYDLLAKIYHHHHGNYYKAKQIILAALDIDNEPFVTTGIRNSIAKRLSKIRGQKTIEKKFNFSTIHASRISGKIGQRPLWIDECTNEQVHVEELCVRYFRRKGWNAIHSENSILTTLFSLLFWDILFAPIPGVFVSEFQVKPLDLNTEYFAFARMELIQDRLSEIRSGKFIEIIERTDDRERPRNTLCIGIQWSKFCRQDIMEIAVCIGSTGLAGICEAYVNLYWSHSGGVPDLCIWRMDEMKIELVEVKGQGDRLSEQQKIWLELLEQLKIPCSVLHVQSK